MFLTRRNKIWYIHWTDENGIRRKLSTKTKKKSDALRFLSSFNLAGKDPLLSNTLLSTFRDEFIEYSRGVHTTKTTNHYKTAFRELIRILGDIPVRSVTVRQIENFAAIKKGEASAWTAKKYLAALSAAFKTAVRWDIITENVFERVKKPRIPEQRPVFFTPEQFDRLLSVIDMPEIRDISIFAVSTGMRLGEIITLRWKDVDTERRVIHVVNYNGFTTKTKKSRTIPISKQVCRLLDIRRSGPRSFNGELVFHDRRKPWRDNKLSAKFKKYVRNAGLPDELRFHSMRHTFASWLVQSGVSLYEVSRLLGHSTIRMSEKYAHLQVETLHASVDKISIVYGEGK